MRGALLVLLNGLGLNCHQGAVKQEGSVLKKYVSKSAHILFFLSFARVSRSSPRTPRHFHRLWSFPAEEHGAKSGVRRLK